MASEVLFTKAAEKDRDLIVLYLFAKLDSPQAASRFLDELDGSIETLGAEPKAFEFARDETLARRKIRRGLFMNYVTPYRVLGNTVVVMRIFHQRQNYARLL